VLDRSVVSCASDMHSSLPNFVFATMSQIATAAVCRCALAACTYGKRN